MCTVVHGGPGYLSRYSDSLQAGRSGDWIPVEARFSAPVQTGPGAHSASCTMGTGSFPGVKRPGRGVDHPPPFSAEAEGRVQLYTSIYSPSGPSGPVLGRTFTVVHGRWYSQNCIVRDTQHNLEWTDAQKILNLNPYVHSLSMLCTQQTVCSQDPVNDHWKTKADEWKYLYNFVQPGSTVCLSPPTNLPVHVCQTVRQRSQ